MKEKNMTSGLYNDIKEIIGATEAQDLLNVLKTKAHNVDFFLRKELEDTLLAVAREVEDIEKRNILYELLVSLAGIWTKNKPKKGLNKTFWDLDEKIKYEKARQKYAELLNQGLDYIDDFNIEPGTLLPFTYGEKDVLLQYNKEGLFILSTNFNTEKQIPLPESMEILDVLPPTPPQADIETPVNEVNQTMWLLIRKEGDDKIVVSIDAETGGLRYSYPLSGEPKKAEAISRFQGRLLLICPGIIFYRHPDAGWEKWITADAEITCVEQTKDIFGVGLSNGNVYLLKEFELVGIRSKFKCPAGAIKSIHSSKRFVAISSENRLSITDFEGELISKPFTSGSKILQSIIVTDDIIAALQANGNIIGVDINKTETVWQINLCDVYDFFFKVGTRIYCCCKDGTGRIFELPDFHRMAKALENRNIPVPEQPIEREPMDPIKYITEFIGRKELLEKIRVNANSHFLISGEPKIGKTSLLNVLPDVLSDNSRGCYIGMKSLLEEVDSYEKFESHFIEKSLAQHFMKLSDLKHQDGYQAFRELVNSIRGDKKFCVFYFDNFSIPKRDTFNEASLPKFKTFIKDMFILPSARIIMAYEPSNKDEIEKFFTEIKSDAKVNRALQKESLPVFSEIEVTGALRTKYHVSQEEVEEIYKYIGYFPNHIHLYDKWKKGEKGIKEYSEEIAKNNNKEILAYFRNLSHDAYLLIALCLNQNLISKKIGLKKFYESYPLLNQLLPRGVLRKALEEISAYSKGFTTAFQEDGFFINMRDKVELFHEASNYIPWLKVFLTLCKFTSGPNQKRADEVASAYSRMVNIGLSSDDLFGELTEQYKDAFYIKRLTREGRQILGMPLVTFLVIPLEPWGKGRVSQDFTSLYISIQEFVRKAKESMADDTVSLKFYILLFELHGIALENIKKSIKGLERVSVIDSKMMTDILFDAHPREKSSEFIFTQLNISERSPYTTSGAVQDELFYGRELEISLIRGLSENIGIFGTRTIGKTSLLLKIQKDIKGQRNWKVFALDCSRIESEESLLKNLAEKMGVSFTEIPDMERFRIYVSREAERNDVQYLFLLDEVDRLVEYDIESGEKIFKTFNKMCTEFLDSGEPAARFILFGFQQMFEQMKNPESRLYNFMVFLPLKPLDDDSALSLVTKPTKNIRVKWQNEKEDARYLADNCSGHPLLLQAACQALLSILDGKKENKDMIERGDIDKALFSDQFQEICMRFYAPEQKDRKYDGQSKTNQKTRKWFGFPFKKSETPSPLPTDDKKRRESFLNDIHRISILVAIRLNVEEKKETFTFTDIHDELKKNRIKISPNQMRNILDHLRLSGVFRLKNEANLLANKDRIVQKKVQERLESEKKKNRAFPEHIRVNKPEEYVSGGSPLLEFTYEFGVKIFPSLLVANFGGLEKCDEELQKLIERGEWKEWTRRY